jgi:hypothetical protein
MALGNFMKIDVCGSKGARREREGCAWPQRRRYNDAGTGQEGRGKQGTGARNLGNSTCYACNGGHPERGSHSHEVMVQLERL